MLSRLRIRHLCLVLAFGLAAVASGCGRKGALFLPPEKGEQPAQQSPAPPNNK